MKSLDPSVSIIIPTCNRVATIERTIQSVQKQTYGNVIEIIITDDSSNNETEKLISELSKKDPRIKYFRNTTYIKGPTGNKQNGLDKCTGDFFGTLDDDDELLPTAISDLMEVHKTLGYNHISGNCVIGNTGKLSGTTYGKSEEFTYEDVLSGKYTGEGWGIVHKDFLKLGRLQDDTWGGESLLWWRFLKKEPAYYLDKVVRVYHLDSGNNATDNYVKFPERTFLTYKYYIDFFGDDLLRISPASYKKLALSAALFAGFSGDAENKSTYLHVAEKSNASSLALRALYLLVKIPLPRKIKSTGYVLAKKIYLFFH